MAEGASTTVAQPYLDVFGTTLDRQFDLDTRWAALVPSLPAPTPMPRCPNADATDQSLPARRVFQQDGGGAQDSTVGWGTSSATFGASTTAARAAWKRSASRHIQAILSGDAQSIRISPHVKIHAHKIGKSG